MESFSNIFLSLIICCYLLLSNPGAGALSREFTTNLAPQCTALSMALKIEKLKAPLFRCPEGMGIQMTGAL